MKISKTRKSHLKCCKSNCMRRKWMGWLDSSCRFLNATHTWQGGHDSKPPKAVPGNASYERCATVAIESIASFVLLYYPQVYGGTKKDLRLPRQSLVFIIGGWRLSIQPARYEIIGEKDVSSGDGLLMCWKVSTSRWILTSSGVSKILLTGLTSVVQVLTTYQSHLILHLSYILVNPHTDHRPLDSLVRGKVWLSEDMTGCCTTWFCGECGSPGFI